MNDRSYLILFLTVLSLNQPVEKKRLTENIFGEGENVGYQHFLNFPLSFVVWKGQIMPLGPPELQIFFKIGGPR